MAIPEQQLKAWAGVGAQQGSADTYNSVKTALAAHNWPVTMGMPNVYLQGSYPNHTNIRGDSDVDIVVETRSVFYSNLTESDLRAAGMPTGSFTWIQFRDEVKKALSSYYGYNDVTQGDKCIKVNGGGNRLNADVVPCNEYRNYQNGYVGATGITFWTQSYIQVVNYPKLHLDNGSAKNQSCLQNYKPNIRVFKNARNRANNDFPSYFVECLLHNVPTSYFGNSHSETVLGALQYLNTVKNDDSLETFLCQNGRQAIFGTAEHQIDILAGKAFINALSTLWDNWA